MYITVFFYKKKQWRPPSKKEERRKIKKYMYIIRYISFVDELLMFPFDGIWGYVRREFLQRLSGAPHGTLGSCLRDAFQEGSADAVACLPIPRA
jgi:hypothetical protein